MKIIISLFIGLICVTGVYSQSGALSGSVSGDKSITVLPDTARYQITALNQVRLTIKLDRFTGKTYQYVNQKRRWYLLEVRGDLPFSAADTPKYQICEDGESVFLINNVTGQTWTLNVTTWERVVD